ncbi:GNAT family N-acetyltransferase [Faecalimicrobium dakarense]|uniref:GNAT family N-acetyltransferase n=1 Tax=Faecalimicrobium dakarense TaxID=1301100 RepID=UPI0004B54FD9|nr:GNAT family N-acetyltransferase [[Clostridium] dakarense]
MDSFIINIIDYDMLDEAFELVDTVFMEFDAPDYSQDGIDEFKKQIIENKEFRNRFKTGEQIMIGAFKDSKVIGVLAISVRNHISLLFVDKNYHRNGVATKLFNKIIIESRKKNVDKIKLNSSPYALQFYYKVGFIATDTEKVKNGIRYTPMEFIL